MILYNSIIVLVCVPSFGRVSPRSSDLRLIKNKDTLTRYTLTLLTPHTHLK